MRKRHCLAVISTIYPHRKVADIGIGALLWYQPFFVKNNRQSMSILIEI